MKIIFLDLDGVLNTSETYKKIYYKYKQTGILDVEIDEFRLEYLKEIIDKTNAKIVLSASSRNSFKKENDKIIPQNKKAQKIYDLFNKYGLEIYDITPSVYNVNDRELQINEWLLNKDIECFIIIDDEPNMFNDLLDRLIKTSKVKDNEMLIDMDDCIGLCKEDINISVEMLNNKKKILKR